ncbi:hypothetical protein C1H76_0959 [Elsinoe australis]|uniref:Uncharacterized protein n=1 Tax=Elsinoe australis TaxID=40998 RepID=A0A4U7B9X5_9PEZI|nr:hypothetical protein C1H76_0959 [Elsinoe australis]
MLFTTFTSPRRLALLAVLVLFSTLILFRNSEYREKISSYTFTGSRPIDADLDASQEGVSQKPVGQAPNDLVADQSGSSRQKHKHKNPGKVQAPNVDIPKPINYSEGPITPVKHLDFADLKKHIKDLTEWDTLKTQNHWPSWDAYKDTDYDPNRWEGFDWEPGYFTRNGVKHLEEKDVKPEPYLPYPNYNTPEWKAQWRGDWAPCEGPRGKLLDESIEDIVMAYRSPAPGFPNPAVGSASVTGLDENVCFDRFHRYGPYGLGQTAMNVPQGWTRPEVRPDWSEKWWGQLQDQCLQKNKHRYAPESRIPMNLIPNKVEPENVDTLDETEAAQSRNTAFPKYQHRTALLIRTWEGYSYTENDLQAIRALVTELSLLSGGEYQVYLFVNVKEHDADIYNNPQKYQDVLRRVVPKELRDISLLWTETVVEEWYPKVGSWEVYWQQFMPLQWFSKTHPEFDYVWNWETDARYTGNHYHFLEKMAEFSRNMPRKNLWERNARFYLPEEHGNFASFLADTDGAIANATASGAIKPVWGPLPYNSEQHVVGPAPPVPYEEDNFSWGAGEEADLITLQPIWDPTDTEWSYRYKIWNFVPGKRPHFTQQDPGDDAYFHPDFAKVPRRVFINTVARFSKKMLHAMHLENRAGRSMQAEMWPATVALQHGLKAVYAPHPIWTDRKWPSWFLDATFNADNGTATGWGQKRDSPYNHDREAAFRGWSWYYSTGFPRIVYRRWLGWRAKDILGDVGGRNYEEGTVRASEDATGLEEQEKTFGGRGRMCLPGMLLHPVKKVKEDDGVAVDMKRANERDRERERQVGEEVKRAKEEKGWTWGEVNR